MRDQDEYGNLYVCWKFTSEMLRLCGGGCTVGKVVYYHIRNRTTVENLIPACGYDLRLLTFQVVSRATNSFFYGERGTQRMAKCWGNQPFMYNNVIIQQFFKCLYVRCPLSITTYHIMTRKMDGCFLLVHFWASLEARSPIKPIIFHAACNSELLWFPRGWRQMVTDAMAGRHKNVLAGRRAILKMSATWIVSVRLIGPVLSKQSHPLVREGQNPTARTKRWFTEGWEGGTDFTYWAQTPSFSISLRFTSNLGLRLN